MAFRRARRRFMKRAADKAGQAGSPVNDVRPQDVYRQQAQAQQAKRESQPQETQARWSKARTQGEPMQRATALEKDTISDGIVRDGTDRLRQTGPEMMAKYEADKKKAEDAR